MILPSGHNPVGVGAAPNGWVIEATVRRQRAWLIKPVELERYTFTFDLERAHVFEVNYHARDTRDCVYCGYFDGKEGTITVHYLTDEYRATIAKEIQNGLHPIPHIRNLQLTPLRRLR